MKIIQFLYFTTNCSTADYLNSVSTFDKKKILNVARGGHGINTDLAWMPGFYDKLAEIGIVYYPMMPQFNEI
jgi:hypothetical protein